ncbi:hypothetical protein D9M72_584930 [compost metagenome]
MADVGGEALDGVHPRRQGVGHRFQGAGQVADLVLAVLKVGQGDGAGALQAHLIRRRRQAHDGARHEHVQHQGRQQVHRQGHQGEGGQGAALGGQGLVHVAGFEGQDAQDLLDVAHGQGDGNHAVAVLVAADVGLGRALQGALDLG